MATRELQNINNSGELTNHQLGGTATDDKVLKKSETDAAYTAQATTTALDARVGVNEGNISTNTTNIATNTSNITTNTSDIASHNTRITANENWIANPKTSIQYTPQNPATVPYFESTMYYNQETGTVDVMGAYSDVVLQAGRELHMEIINNSGATILNGYAVRHNGVVGGRPQVELALADTFINGRILGVATHDIPNGEVGIITTSGLVSGMDTSLLPEGVPLFLSDTVPGWYTATPPDVVSQVGGVTVSALDGTLSVAIDNSLALPNIYANMSDGQLPVTLAQGVPSTIDNYVDPDSSVMGTNAAAGLINVPIDGRYRITVSGIIRYDQIGNAEQELELLLESNDSLDQHSINVPLPRNSALASMTLSTSKPLIGGKDYRLRVTALNSTLTNVSTLAEYDITSTKLNPTA